MALEQIVTGRKYRVLADATSRIWHRLSFWTSSHDVEMDDGKSVQQNLGGIKGITTSSSVTQTGYALDATAYKDLNTKLVGKTYTLPANTSTYTITDSSIKSTSIIQVFPSVFKAAPIDMTQSGNSVTITFAPRSTAMQFKVVIM